MTGWKWTHLPFGEHRSKTTAARLKRMKLSEAIAAMDERIAEHKRQREVVTKIFQTVLPLLKPHGQTVEEWATEKADLIDPDLWTMPKAGADLSVECVQACSDALAAFAKIWRERNAE